MEWEKKAVEEREIMRLIANCKNETTKNLKRRKRSLNNKRQDFYRPIQELWEKKGKRKD